MESGIMELVVKYIPGVKANEMRIQQIINTHCQKYDLSSSFGTALATEIMTNIHPLRRPSNADDVVLELGKLIDDTMLMRSKI